MYIGDDISHYAEMLDITLPAGGVCYITRAVSNSAGQFHLLPLQTSQLSPGSLLHLPLHLRRGATLRLQDDTGIRGGLKIDDDRCGPACPQEDQVWWRNDTVELTQSSFWFQLLYGPVPGTTEERIKT